MAGFTAFHRARSGILIGLIVAFLATALVKFRPSAVDSSEEMGLSLAALAERLELFTFDQRMRHWAGRHEATSPFVMVNVDDEVVMGAMSRTRPWPWKKAVVGELLAELTRLGAKAIVIDPQLLQARTSWKDDQNFSQSLKDFSRVVMGFEFTDLAIQRSPPDGRFGFPIGVFETREDAWRFASSLRPRMGHSYYLLAARPDEAEAAQELKEEAAVLLEEGASAGGSGASAGKPSKGNGAPKSGSTGARRKAEAKKSPSASASAAVSAQPSASQSADDSASPDEVQDTEPKFYGYALWRGGLSDREAALSAAVGPVSKSLVRELTSREMFHQVGAEGILRETVSLPNEDVPAFAESFQTPRILSSALLLSGAAFGACDLLPSMDSVIRHVRPVVRHDGKFYPSLALAVASVLQPDAALSITPTHLIWNGRAFALDELGQMGLRSFGGSASLNRPDQPWEELSAARIFQSAAQVASGRVTDKAIQDAVEGKVVFLAPTSSIFHSEVETSLGTKSRAFVWALAAEDLMKGSDFVRADTDFDSGVAFALALLGGLLTSLCLRILRPRTSALNWLVLTALSLGVFVIYQHQAFEAGRWVAVVVPILAFCSSSFLTAFYVTADGMRAVGHIWDALGRATPLSVTEKLLVSPKLLNMKGEARVLTVLFFDIIRFNERLGGLKPDKMVSLMREVWTAFSDEVARTDGQMGHTVGDSVLAYWGAPIENKRRTLDAVKCALAIQSALSRKVPKLKERFGVDVGGALAVVSGEAVLGDFGCGGLRPDIDYMPMGSPVSQSKRLCSLSGRWNGRILLSESAWREVESSVEVRCLGVARINSGDELTAVYELLALKGGLSKAELARITRYNQAFTLVTKRDFLSAKALLVEILKEAPDDAPSAMLLARCDQCIAQPPPETWQGFFELT